MKPLDTEFSDKFIAGMKNRMEVSYYKYGPIKEAYPLKVSAIKSLELRLKKYAEDGNLEHLIDIANYAMIEFMLPAHPKAKFCATDDSGSPGRKWHSGGPANKKKNSD